MSDWSEWQTHDGSKRCPIPWACAGEFQVVARGQRIKYTPKKDARDCFWQNCTDYRYDLSSVKSPLNTGGSDER